MEMLNCYYFLSSLHSETLFVREVPNLEFSCRQSHLLRDDEAYV